MLDTFARALLHALRDAPAPPGARVRLVVTGQAGGAWLATRSADGWRLGQPASGPADATVTLDQDLAWRLFTRGVDPARAAPRVGIEGDGALAAAVLRMVAILA